jgi:AcrR family transcriptional regulator
VSVAEADGFGALSLRSVARRLGVGPMTLYTYVDSSDELAGLVIDHLVADAIHGSQWPRQWQAVLRLFAKRLHALVLAHPAMVEAYGRGIVRSDLARRVADDVKGRLVADGLTPEAAGAAYLGVHSLVLGHALIVSGFQVADVSTDPEGQARRDAELSVPLDLLVDELLAGVASTSSSGSTARREQS